ncbi:MAG TPA: HD domain-containing phosphohydrolase [Thiobacillus sp.]
MNLSTVNPHYLERAIDLSANCEIRASEDIYDAKGMKLLAKGTALAPGMQERLIRHKLLKPLETSLVVADGVSIDLVLEIARQLLDELKPLQACSAQMSVRQSPLDVLAKIGLNNSMTTLLTMSYQTEGQRHFRHTVLVGLIATLLAMRGGLPPDGVLSVAHAGLLHDIGEMYLNPAYLTSGAHLKPDEWKHVVVHPMVGQMVITEMTAYPPAVARAVGEHHERHDGSGYPRRIAHEQISREGSIVAAAETLGGIFMRPDNPLHCACLAMKIIPGEYASEVVSNISSIVQSLPDALATETISSFSELTPHLHTLQQKLVEVLAQCDAIKGSPLAQKPSVQAVLQRVTDRIQVIQRSLVSSGVGACLLEPHQDAAHPEILLELEVVSRELAWRLRDLARDVALHLPKDEADVDVLFAGLIDALDQLE